MKEPCDRGEKAVHFSDHGGKDFCGGKAQPAHVVLFACPASGQADRAAFSPAPGIPDQAAGCSAVGKCRIPLPAQRLLWGDTKDSHL